ncbi:MAG TPA: hypothetical protein VGZ47_05905 [Gemmataceae bacterium]|jgi:hypothetical protein|nr:hypothetical protein [Gemmataceae bacterium]
MPVFSHEDWEGLVNRPPYRVDWRNGDGALPQRLLRPRGRRLQLPFYLAAPPHFATGPAEAPFDFSGHMLRLCHDLTAWCEELQQIDVSRILFTVTSSRTRRAQGLQARVTPMRFRHGQLSRRHRGEEHQVQRFRVDGREILYLMTYCLPRFLDQNFDEKFITILHELFHIGPKFDGDLRRHEGRYEIHTHSQKEYDAQMAQLAREYLAGQADPSLHAFLRLNFAQLCDKHGGVTGVCVPRPKILPLPRRPSPTEY